MSPGLLKCFVLIGEISEGRAESAARADAFSMFLDPPGVPEHPLFRDVDLSHLKLGI